MESYLVLLADANKIHSKQDELISKCNAFSAQNEFSVFRSFSFVEGTGFMRSVRDEISLVLQCYEVENICFWRFEEFVRKWGLERYLDYDIAELSGGWKKFLGLALFTNQISDGKIYFDASSHLSDRLIELFVRNVMLVPSKFIFFFEYDIGTLNGFDLKQIWDRPTSFRMDPIEGRVSFAESNYE